MNRKLPTHILTNVPTHPHTQTSELGDYNKLNLWLSLKIKTAFWVHVYLKVHSQLHLSPPPAPPHPTHNSHNLYLNLPIHPILILSCPYPSLPPTPPPTQPLSLIYPIPTPQYPMPSLPTPYPTLFPPYPILTFLSHTPPLPIPYPSYPTSLPYTSYPTSSQSHPCSSSFCLTTTSFPPDTIYGQEYWSL